MGSVTARPAVEGEHHVAGPRPVSLRDAFTLRPRSPTGGLVHIIDRLNRVFGPNIVYFGSLFGAGDTASMRIPFNAIPSADPAIHGSFRGRYRAVFA